MTEKNKPVFPKGRLYFDGGLLPGDDEIILMRPREEMIRPAGTVTGRFSGKAIPHFMKAIPQCIMPAKTDDRMSPELKRFRDQLEFYRFRAYYSERIAFLLTSKDPRQRKRGQRLRCKKSPFATDFSEAEARMTLHLFREAYPDIKDFWQTELGEPYDPVRYRKD